MILARVNDAEQVVSFHVGTRKDFDSLSPSDSALRFIDRPDLWFLDDIGVFFTSYSTFYFDEDGDIQTTLDL